MELTRPLGDISSSATVTIESTEESASISHEESENVLHLQPEPVRRVRWTVSTVDNEHMNKKKSKVCCIFHKQRKFDESSSDSDSDSDSDSSCSSCCSRNAYERA
ncbi:Type 1 phosphatases regulator ypi1 [Schizosaccharomyces pombe]|uniref:Type 1 phosphatases regulator ypi1 n=1 Tax=Schizosaccharomyces pombe (strain 972 / ATCC 24843) TaxID=284812 RepID=YPI1_SCHPO|nr:putative protein phosphatase inhibitor [Schizosaccharomyces pombe]O14218.1 RecName: Full=Type 1 phosphatases regulator ypi1 [Schizosaccharomyces pombe 972h-]CAB11073.1 protein phosphatase inhibitor (predicted) [Schizosaccharomyces pombe]|eukprot:NP_593768.1 putative protein phosphatase inhibitor [Schizosaccharomyces pombe]